MVDVTPEQLTHLIEQVLAPGHFFMARGMDLTCTCAEEELPWEVFRGRLLDPAHTRERRTFRSWNVHLFEEKSGSPEPLLSLKWDRQAGQIHVTRGLPCYVWEAYDAGDNVIRSREREKWVRELVGTINLHQFSNPDDLREEVSDRVFQAVVGTSRLPLNPVEAPLPLFSCGRFAFFDSPAGAGSCLRSFRELINNAHAANLPWLQSVKLFEFVLRIASAEDIGEAALLLADYWTRRRGRAVADFPKLFRTLFNEISLSPYTSFVDNALAFLQALVDQGTMTVEDHVDFLSYLLRQICRHLTAYDLITFHHRGANYPDALLLDATLKAYLKLIDSHSGLFVGADKPARLRRRALRQACLVRRFYEGQPVPDAPTSPGESSRVLPPPHIRVPDEQILQPLKRRKQLYAGEPTTQLLDIAARTVLDESIRDLQDPNELRELGMAVFIDRPLGTGKALGELDQTPLLAHEAFSRSIAARRLNELADFAGVLPLDGLLAQVAGLQIAGFPVRHVALPDRPVVSLADARRVAEDFVFLQTLPGSIRQFFELFDSGPLQPLDLDFLSADLWLLIVRPADSPGSLAIYDNRMRRRLELSADLSRGFRIRRGIEFPAAGLRVQRVWSRDSANGSLRATDLAGKEILLGPPMQ
jgi:hypothetical protein